MWLQHLFGLLGATVRIFFDAIGTTILGRIVDFVLAIAVTIALLRKTFREDGWRAMLNKFQQQYRAGLRFAIYASIAVYSPVAVWSVGKAVYEDHTYFVGVVRRQTTSIKIASVGAQREKDICQEASGKLREQIAGLGGQASTLQSQNRNQQNSINNCQTKALALLTPAPQKTVAVMLDDNAISGTALRRTRYLLMTNKVVTPVAFLISCDAPILNSFGFIVGNPAVGGAQPIGDKAVQITVSLPPWTPSAPLVLDIEHATTKRNMLCKFEQR